MWGFEPRAAGVYTREATRWQQCLSISQTGEIWCMWKPMLRLTQGCRFGGKSEQAFIVVSYTQLNKMGLIHVYWGQIMEKQNVLFPHSRYEWMWRSSCFWRYWKWLPQSDTLRSCSGSIILVSPNRLTVSILHLPLRSVCQSVKYDSDLLSIEWCWGPPLILTSFSLAFSCFSVWAFTVH